MRRARPRTPPTRLAATLALAAGLLVLMACGDEARRQEEERAPAEEPAGEEADFADPRAISYAPSLDVDLDAMERRPSGLYVEVLEEGEGPPARAGDRMGVHYTVWFPDGTTLDSSRPRGEPLGMVLGETPLIDGWTEGVTGMRLGERRRLVVPWQLAYGAEGRPPQVPPYATLVFEVELARHEPAGG